MRNWTSSSLLSPSRGTPTLPDSQVQAAVYDTDVASRSFKGRLPAALAARLVGRQPLVTFVTVGELTQWTRLRRWGPRNRAMLDDWLADKLVIPGGELHQQRLLARCLQSFAQAFKNLPGIPYSGRITGASPVARSRKPGRRPPHRR